MGKIRVAFQGVQGAHTSTAIEKAFPDQNVDPIPFSTYEQAFEAVENKDCDYAVIPMENSLQGSIHSNYFLLARKFLYIVKEVHVPIHYSLIGLPDAKIEEISLVITQPVHYLSARAIWMRCPENLRLKRYMTLRDVWKCC